MGKACRRQRMSFKECSRIAEYCKQLNEDIKLGLILNLGNMNTWIIKNYCVVQQKLESKLQELVEKTIDNNLHNGIQKNVTGCSL